MIIHLWSLIYRCRTENKGVLEDLDFVNCAPACRGLPQLSRDRRYTLASEGIMEDSFDFSTVSVEIKLPMAATPAIITICLIRSALRVPLFFTILQVTIVPKLVSLILFDDSNSSAMTARRIRRYVYNPDNFLAQALYLFASIASAQACHYG